MEETVVIKIDAYRELCCERDAWRMVYDHLESVGDNQIDLDADSAKMLLFNGDRIARGVQKYDRVAAVEKLGWPKDDHFPNDES